MRNAIVYGVNDKEKVVMEMLNSINSVAAYNETMPEVIILTDDSLPELNLDSMDKRAKEKCTVIPTDCSKYRKIDLSGGKKRMTCHAFLRYEMFCNPFFLDFDNLLYIDVDTDCADSLDDVFIERTTPAILLGRETINCICPRGIPKYSPEIKCKKYYNSGLILVTPKLIGKEKLNAIFDEIMRIAGLGIPFRATDQEIFNAVLGEERFEHLVGELPTGYNFSQWVVPGHSSDEVAKATEFKIRHWGGGYKYELKYI